MEDWRSDCEMLPYSPSRVASRVAASFGRRTREVCANARRTFGPLFGESDMTVRYVMLTIECGHCGSRMKKLVDALRITDVQLACPGCESELRVTADDVRADLARRRLEFLRPDAVPARPVKPGETAPERRCGPHDRRRRTRADRRARIGPSGRG